MVTDRVAKELRTALDSLRVERDTISKQITAMETLLNQMGAPARRGPGRPKGSGVKRGPGRPRKEESLRPSASASTSAPAPSAGAPVKRGPGRPKGSKNKRGPGRPKGTGTKQAAAKTQRRAPKWSTAARESARQRMQAYWAERKKKGGSGS